MWRSAGTSVVTGARSRRMWRDASPVCAGVRSPIRWNGSSPYLKARFVDDPHVWASALFDEVVPLGYGLSYPSFVRQLRAAGLRPHCEACDGVRERDTIEIAHPPGEEIQWDWFERRRAPWGGTGYVLLGTLPHSGPHPRGDRPGMDQPHLIEAMDGVLRRLGGTARRWRVDRMATVIVPGHRRRAGQLRSGGQVLRGDGGAVPAATGEPQGIGGSGGAFRHRAVVADVGGGHSGGGAGEPGPVLVDDRAMPGCAARRGSWTRPPTAAGRGGRRSASWPKPSRCCRCRRCRSRPRSKRPRPSTTKPASLSAGTATRCRPGWPG